MSEFLHLQMLIAYFHTLHDGTRVGLLGAKQLITIPIWQNNRNLHSGHVDRLAKQALPQLLDRNYYIAILQEEDASGSSVQQPYIIDGQHRSHVLRRYFSEHPDAEDFPILIYEKVCQSESEVIEAFNAINTIQPLKPWEDEACILNNYIDALLYEFNKPRKTVLIRTGVCRRPYLSTEAIREGLRSVLPHLVKSQDGANEFARLVRLWNDRHVKDAEVFVTTIRASKDAEMFQKGVTIGFVLAHSDKLKWIAEIVKK